jgi:hypothetical protein
MMGVNGYLLFLTLLIAAVVCFVIGRPWLGLALLVGAVAVFARWPVDLGGERR